MGGSRDADEGLTPGEREMLASLSSGGGAAPDAARQTTTGPVPGPAEVLLSDEEEQVLRQAESESRRVAREELPTMFDRGAEEGAERTAQARAAKGGRRSPRSERSEASPVRETRPGRALAAAVDLVNRPFRWISPVWRMGLGLCGVLLLAALLVVMLMRTLFDT